MVAATFAYSTGSFANRLARLRRIAWLLDAQFALPGMRFRCGINARIGLAPGIGDALLLPTRELARVLIRMRRQADAFEQRRCLGLRLGAGPPQRLLLREA